MCWRGLICTYVCLYVRTTLAVTSQGLSSLVIETESLTRTRWGLPIWSGWLASKSPGIFLSLCPRYSAYRCTHLPYLAFFFTRGLGLTLRAGTLQTKTSLCLYGFSLPPMNCPNTFFPTMTGIKKMKHHLNTVVTILSNMTTKTATKWLTGR